MTELILTILFSFITSPYQGFNKYARARSLGEKIRGRSGNVHPYTLIFLTLYPSAPVLNTLSSLPLCFAGNYPKLGQGI